MKILEYVVSHPVQMRLINCFTLRLETFDNEYATPPYAILSHCWGKEEVLYADITAPPAPGEDALRTISGGWKKVCMACETTKLVYGLQYIWIDTCCIDKSSSAELSEAINSMWKWYWRSEICIAYLEDVTGIPEDPRCFTSRWFTRGWTLQELIAPQKLDFFDRMWVKLGDRATMASMSLWTTELCNIDRRVLQDGGRKLLQLREFSAATLLSWASRRVTTRSEDRAYSLLGIFGVNMGTLYGEGYERAFLRLQAKIFKASADQSIFAWVMPPKTADVPTLDDRVYPWNCEVYGETNKLCQEMITGLSCIPYIDAIRPWRLNYDEGYGTRQWTTNINPFQTTNIFAPSLECFDTQWHLRISRSHSFDFQYTSYSPATDWSFRKPAPSQRYGPRTQMVMTRLTAWIDESSSYSKESEAEYALYLCILPIRIVPKHHEHPDHSLPKIYVGIHLLESSLEPGNFRRVNMKEVYLVNMDPVKAFEDHNYWPQGWCERPDVKNNIFRLKPLQEIHEMEVLRKLQKIIPPKIKDVFLSRVSEEDPTLPTMVQPGRHLCVRLQWVFLETGKLERDGWEVTADTVGDMSGMQQCIIRHFDTPRTKRKHPEERLFTTWYRHPTRHLFDKGAEKATLRVLLSDKTTGEAFGIHLSTRVGDKDPADKDHPKGSPSDIESSRRFRDHSWMKYMFSTRIQIQSPRAYRLAQQLEDASYKYKPRMKSSPEVFQVCSCESHQLTEPNTCSTSFGSTSYAASPSLSTQSLERGNNICEQCGGCYVSEAMDVCNRFVVFQLRSGRTVTVGFVEPKRRLIDGSYLGPMLILKVVIGGPAKWLEEANEDQENGLEPSEVGTTLWREVGLPPDLKEAEREEAAAKAAGLDRDSTPINIGGWGAFAMTRR